MDMFYAEKLWQKAKEEWGIEDTHPSYNKILQAFVWGVQHVPEGYAIVPVEPTEEMLEAGRCESDGPANDVFYIYQAMIKAAQECE